MKIPAVLREITMLNWKSLLFFAFCMSHSLIFEIDLVYASNGVNETAQPTYASVHIGAVLDLKSPMGNMADLCLSMALSDFYSLHSNYKTRLFLDTMNAEAEIEVASAVLELLKVRGVHGVLGPQWFTEATFVAELGERVHMPIISFTAKGQSLSAIQNPYFVCTTPDDSYQAKALADICKGFEWHEVVILYEDTDYGNQFISKLNKAFQEHDIRLAYMTAVSTSAKDAHILKELYKLMTMQTRVFLVHMNNSLGCKLFFLAKKVGMMREGYAWLITDSLLNFLNSVECSFSDSMDGVLGIRPRVPKSTDLDNFKVRWKRNALLMKPEIAMELNVYGLWAYDTVWALAMAIENILKINSDLLKSSQSENESDILNLRVSLFGRKLLSEILDTKFKGLSGEFQLVNGQLRPSAFEIFNMMGTGDRTIGYWIPDRGISRELAVTGESTYSTSTKELKAIIWPGDSVVKPIGWGIPSTGKLRVGVPKRTGFTEFANVQIDPLTNNTNVCGFSIDIFLASLQLLPFKLDYEFIPYMNTTGNLNGSYNDMLHKIRDKTYDFVVGDVTILADRSTFVDFTLPYTESGVVMVVKNKKSIDMWIFLKPLRWDLWLTIVIACIFIGIVLRILEHRMNNTPHRQELGLLIWFPIAALAIPERNMVANKWSRFIMVIWLFVAYILMQSYTAKLSSIFTVDQLRFEVSKDYFVGYQRGSFVKDFLINELRFNVSKMRNYSRIEEYHDAMSLGSRNGGIDAIFGEIPYMKLFLNKYGSEYKIIGRTYKTDGFGFAFPLGSPLVGYFSRAILNVTQGPNMTAIEQKNFGVEYPSDQDSSINQDASLTAYNFGGLFIIIGSATIFALFCSETSVGQRFTAAATYYAQRCSIFPPFSGQDSRVHSIDHGDGNGRSSSEDKIDESEPTNTNDPARPAEVHVPDYSGSDDSARQGEVPTSNQRNTNVVSVGLSEDQLESSNQEASTGPSRDVSQSQEVEMFPLSSQTS